jgi:hypothetical protein
MKFDHDTSLGCVPSEVFAFGLRLSMGRGCRSPTFTSPLQTGVVDPKLPSALAALLAHRDPKDSPRDSRVGQEAHRSAD